MRKHGTTRIGGSFDEWTTQQVWNKATAVPGYNSAEWRKDHCGAWIGRNQYGQTTDHGWEIDHIKPLASGGSDELSNLQPLQWQNNRHKADNWPTWSCAVAANG